MRIHRPDRLIILLCAVALLALWGGVLLDRWLLQPQSKLLSLDEAAMDSLEAAWSGEEAGDDTYYAVPVQPVETFPFDPNTADSTSLLRLGLAPWQVRAIYKYRARGGRYHRVEDFQRLPGMTPELWNRLEPVVRIGEAYRYYDREALARKSQDSSFYGGVRSSESRRNHFSDSSFEGSSGGNQGGEPHPVYPRQEKFAKLTLLDLNAVDTITLKKVPGIASYRARQIVRYRDRLGGFTSVEQLSEIEGLPLELQAWFKVETPVFRKLNLNKDPLGNLARHPYIGYARAKAIDGFRRTQGEIHSLDELSLLPDFSSDVIKRLEPYIEF